MWELSLLDAEYSFIFTTSDAIYYGRDRCGTRSLMKNKQKIDFYLEDGEMVECNGIYMEKDGKTLFYPYPNIKPIGNFESLLREAVLNRTKEKTCILFSGGLDSTVLSLLTKDAVLLNLSFSEKAQDRQSSLLAQKELKNLGCNHELIQILIQQEEVDLHKQQILKLIKSHSKMDYALAVPFYFGCLYSPCDVIISGLGPDEMMGGYMRHKTKQNLEFELENDFLNIPIRNLNRDSKIAYFFKKQVYFPYLAPKFQSFVRSLSLKEKCNFDLDLGDKLILRNLALQLGLKETSRRRKKAMQFGSRSSKLQ